MFYRRKIILALLQIFGGELEKIRLQKLLFLFAKSKQDPEYDFIPYKYGCFSFSANADLNALAKKGIISDLDSSFKKLDSTDYLKSLKISDKNKIEEIKNLYGKMNTSALMQHTYINFPFWATKSLKAKEILTEKNYEKVLNSIPKNNKTILYTIGYEGISLEEYLFRLLKNDIKILVDVRRNPLSMKYGFSKSQLIKYCQALDIQYIHFPDVGINSDERQELNNQRDYDILFENYKRKNLPNTIDSQEKILNLLIENKRVALTCFEANVCQCHRTHLAEAISLHPKFIYSIEHI